MSFYVLAGPRLYRFSTPDLTLKTTAALPKPEPPKAGKESGRFSAGRAAQVPPEPEFSGGTSLRGKMIMQADSIIACAIAYAIRKRPELVPADILKLMRQKAS
jgi:hypothetical protein